MHDGDVVTLYHSIDGKDVANGGRNQGEVVVVRLLATCDSALRSVVLVVGKDRYCRSSPHAELRIGKSLRS